MMAPRFSAEDFNRAHGAWGCNCGPGAIAAVLGLTLDELRPHMGDFEKKRYTNPTLMFDVLGRLHVNFRRVSPAAWPDYGLVRIQWEGPWTEPGVPVRARYRHTHWVGSKWSEARQQYGVFDVNALGNGSGWCAIGDWRETIVPWIIQELVPKSSGRWHITHGIEVRELR